MLHVPYRGAGPALNDLIPGRVDVMFNNIGAVLPLIQGGKLRGLAVTTAKRTPAAPDLPPIAEVGVPGFDVSSWYAFFAPAKTPPEIIAQDARRHGGRARRSRDQGAARKQLGVVVVGSTPAELAAHPQVGNGQVGTGDQGSRHHDARITHAERKDGIEGGTSP